MGCHHDDPYTLKRGPVHAWAESQPDPDKDNARDFALVTNAFAFKVFSAMDKPGDNALISPISMVMALGMLATGARGETQKAIYKVLQTPGGMKPLNDDTYAMMVDLLKPGDSPMAVSNSYWWLTQRAQPGADFTKQLTDNFGAKLTSVTPKEAQVAFRQWILQSTAGMIKDNDRLPPQTDAVFVNCTAFIDAWKLEFNPTKTGPDIFTTARGKEQTVPFMNMSKASIPSAFKDDYEAIMLPYKNADYGMVMILPGKGSPEDFLRKQSWESWSSLLGDLYQRDVDLMIPKMTCGASYDLIGPFKKLGLGSLLGSGDYSGINPAFIGDFVGQATHKTFIEVTEKGTRAAASTKFVMTKSMSKSYSFEADRPFAYAIIHKPTEAILFLGVCNDPSKQ